MSECVELVKHRGAPSDKRGRVSCANYIVLSFSAMKQLGCKHEKSDIGLGEITGMRVEE